MKSVFEPATRTELINRIKSITEQNHANWGKMNAYQMVKHCTRCEDMYLGNLKIKRVFIGKLIGPMVLRKHLKDKRPFGKNAPTSSLLKSPELNGDMEKEKKEWISRIEQYSNFSNNGFVHPFFGPMTKEQVGWMAYKHSDHHLRQFGV